MQQTNDLGLNIIEETDPLEPEPLNENASILEDAIAGTLSRISALQDELEALEYFTGYLTEDTGGEPDEGEPDEGQPDEGEHHESETFDVTITYEPTDTSEMEVTIVEAFDDGSITETLQTLTNGDNVFELTCDNWALGRVNGCEVSYSDKNANVSQRDDMTESETAIAVFEQHESIDYAIQCHNIDGDVIMELTDDNGWRDVRFDELGTEGGQLADIVFKPTTEKYEARGSYTESGCYLVIINEVEEEEEPETEEPEGDDGN